MPADPSLIEHLDPFELLDIECARVDRFLSTLPEDGWARPTRCSEWSVRDMLGHLAFIEDYNRAGLEGSVKAFAEETGAESFDDFNAWGVRRYADRSHDDVLAYWREANATWRTAIRALGRDGTVDTSVGPYPSWQQAFYLAAEYAIHGDDMGVAVADDEHAGRDRWRAEFTTYALGEYDRVVDLAALGLSDHDLSEAGAARLPEDFPIAPDLRATLACLA